VNENYIVFTNGELNKLQTELYESMFEDNNDKEVYNISKKMIDILKEIQEALDKS